VISLSLVFSCRAEIRRLIAGSFFCQGRLCTDDCWLFLGRGKFAVSVSVDKVRQARGNSLLPFCCSGGRGGCFCGILAREFQ
jgi:hypothetical protein